MLVPIPTFPFEKTVNNGKSVEEAMYRGLIPGIPLIEREATGEVVPIPTLPSLFQTPVLPAKNASAETVRPAVVAFVTPNVPPNVEEALPKYRVLAVRTVTEALFTAN